MKNKSFKEYLANGHKCLHKYMIKVVVMIFIIGLVVVFRDGIQSLIEPVFSKFTNNSEWIGIWVFLVSVITCCVVYYREKDRIPFLSQE